MMGLSGCDAGGRAEEKAAAEPSPPSSGTPGRATPAAAPRADATTAADGAPAFAVVYPGGTVEGPPVTAASDEAAGGLVTYLTDAEPDAVIAFHREKAEAAGLASVMAMNQGEARAYGAAKDQTNLQVVASPTPEGRTSVQLSWNAET
jgi:hypothetical protein